jgi:hypothetical protein
VHFAIVKKYSLYYYNSKLLKRGVLMSFWWEDTSRMTKKVPSLDTGSTNAHITVVKESIFKSENFQNISSMFTKEELQVARFKADNRSVSDIAAIMNMTEKEVSDMLKVMSNIYYATYNEEDRTISSRSR